MCIPPIQKIDKQMDELLKEEQAIRGGKIARSIAFRATPPKVQDRKIARKKIGRSMTPETSDLITSILEARNFFEEDFPEKEDINLDPDKFSAKTKTVSTSKNSLSTRIVKNDQLVD